jgi:outer membrane protein assembly factor BamB
MRFMSLCVVVVLISGSVWTKRDAAPAQSSNPGESDGNWPMFRGPNASGVAEGHTTLTEWDVPSGRGVLWKSDIPGLSHASPIVWGDKLIVVTAVAKGMESPLKVGLYGAGDSADDMVEHQWKVICLDKTSGKVRWERTAKTGVPRVKRHTKATHANTSPATDGNVVVAFFGSEGVYAYSLDGELKWSKDLGVLDVGPWNDMSLQWGFASSPVICDGKVFLQCDVKSGPFLVALDAADGREIWRTSRDEVPGWCTPAILRTGLGTQVVLNGCKRMGGYDTETGKEIWWMRGGGGIPVPAPLVAGDLVVLTSNHRPIDDQDRPQPIYAVRSSARGNITMNKEAESSGSIAWAKSRRGNYMQTPLAYRGLVYFCKEIGVATCYDLRSGEQKWRERIGMGQTGFSASPVAADGKIYWTSETGDVRVIAAGPAFEDLATNPMDDICMATPAVSDGVIYFRTRHAVIAIGAKQ